MLKNRLYRLLDGSDQEDTAGQAVNFFLVYLILDGDGGKGLRGNDPNPTFPR